MAPGPLKRSDLRQCEDSAIVPYAALSPADDNKEFAVRNSDSVALSLLLCLYQVALDIVRIRVGVRVRVSVRVSGKVSVRMSVRVRVSVMVRVWPTIWRGYFSS